jgi:hypothetical protein
VSFPLCTIPSVPLPTSPSCGRRAPCSNRAPEIDPHRLPLVKQRAVQIGDELGGRGLAARQGACHQGSAGSG